MILQLYSCAHHVIISGEGWHQSAWYHFFTEFNYERLFIPHCLKKTKMEDNYGVKQINENNRTAPQERLTTA